MLSNGTSIRVIQGNRHNCTPTVVHTFHQNVINYHEYALLITLSKSFFRSLLSTSTIAKSSLCTAAAKFKSRLSGLAAILAISSSWENTQNL